MKFLKHTLYVFIVTNCAYLVMRVYSTTFWGQQSGLFPYVLMGLIVLLCLDMALLFTCLLKEKHKILGFVPLAILILSVFFPINVLSYSVDWKFRHYRQDYQRMAELILADKLPHPTEGKWTSLKDAYVLPDEHKHLTVEGYAQRNYFYNKSANFPVSQNMRGSIFIAYTPEDCDPPIYERCLDKNWVWHR